MFNEYIKILKERINALDINTSKDDEEALISISNAINAMTNIASIYYSRDAREFNKMFNVESEND